jgi:hypothetical protein
MHQFVNRRLQTQQQQQQLMHAPLFQSIMVGRKAPSPTSGTLALGAVTASAPTTVREAAAGAQTPYGLPVQSGTNSTIPVAMPIDKKIALLNQCVRFDKELVMLEVYLVFGLWFTCQQVDLPLLGAYCCFKHSTDTGCCSCRVFSRAWCSSGRGSSRVLCHFQQNRRPRKYRQPPQCAGPTIAI